jgi:hypothetical protein
LRHGKSLTGSCTIWWLQHPTRQKCQVSQTYMVSAGYGIHA